MTFFFNSFILATHIHTKAPTHRENEKRTPTPSSRPSVRTIVQRVYVFLDISTAFGRAGCKPVHAFNKSDAYHTLTHSHFHSPSLPPFLSLSRTPHTQGSGRCGPGMRFVHFAVNADSCRIRTPTRFYSVHIHAASPLTT